MMREAIRQYVEREKRRESFRQDAINAWETYQATGQHVAAEKAVAWFAQLEAGKDVAPPKCRA